MSVSVTPESRLLPPLFQALSVAKLRDQLLLCASVSLYKMRILLFFSSICHSSEILKY